MLRNALRLGAALALSATSLLAQTDGTPYTANYAGQLITGTTDLLTGGSWSTPFTVSWSVQQDAQNPTLLRYSYTFGGAGYDAPSISHTIVQLTGGCGAACATGATYNNIANSVQGGSQIGSYASGTSGNTWSAGLDAWSMYGVKFDQQVIGTVTTLSFLSTQIPVWGDIYVKGGNSSFAYNAGLEDPTLTGAANYVVRPDGAIYGGPQNVVPEPSTYVLLASGMVGVVGIARRRKQQG